MNIFRPELEGDILTVGFNVGPCDTLAEVSLMGQAGMNWFLSLVIAKATMR